MEQKSGSRPDRGTTRIEAFSDGVFAIAITLLVLEIKVPTHEELHDGLMHALLAKWPSYLSFFIGFFTVLVCWINHHFLLQRIQETTHGLILANSFNLFLVSFVPFPTAVLAESFTSGDLSIAVQLFGVAYILMPLSYWILAGFVTVDLSAEHAVPDARTRKSCQRIYLIAVAHSIVTFLLSFYSIPAALVLYVLLFGMFLFPDNYARYASKAWSS